VTHQHPGMRLQGFAHHADKVLSWTQLLKNVLVLKIYPLMLEQNVQPALMTSQSGTERLVLRAQHPLIMMLIPKLAQYALKD
jgi:hypothetical protein